MEDKYKVKQIWPAHADNISCFKDKFLNQLFEDEIVVAQRKYDGERMLVHFNKDETYCTSRRQSKKTGRYMENQDKIKSLPHLNLNYTVIDCEFYSDTWSDAVGVLHSLPERAYQLQETTNVHFAVFDCLFFDGIDVRDQPYEVRLQYVHQILALLYSTCNETRFHFVEYTIVKNLSEVWQLANDYWSQGYEGIVLKPYTKAYYDKGMMIKVKRTETVDVVVYDYQPGNGKYSDVVGALLVGYYEPETDTIKHVSKVNCGTDEDRQYWKTYFDEMTFKHVRRVLEVKCQEITDKSLRHPVYVRIRDDKDYTMCTKETIFKE